MAKSPLTAVIDIGHSKTVCFIADFVEGKGPQVLGIGHHETKGMAQGAVTDFQGFQESIMSAVHAAERMASVAVDSVFISCAGVQAASHYTCVKSDLNPEQPIVEEDIRYLLREGRAYLQDAEREVLHVIPAGFKLDGVAGIENPVGLSGREFEVSLHAIVAPAGAVRNLVQCFAHCQLHVEGIIHASYATGFGCLSEEEKKIGTLLVDIGGGLTNLTAYADGHLVAVDSVPIGGLHITRDLARGLSTTLRQAERLKVLHGTALGSAADARHMLPVPTLDGDEEEDTQEVAKSEITGIIRARVEELFEMIAERLDAPRMQMVRHRVVLTGGGALLSNIDQLASQILSTRVRLAKVRMLDGQAESTFGPPFATVVGLLILLDSPDYHKGIHSGYYSGNKESFLVRTLNWIRYNF